MQLLWLDAGCDCDPKGWLLLRHGDVDICIMHSSCWSISLVNYRGPLLLSFCTVAKYYLMPTTS